MNVAENKPSPADEQRGRDAKVLLAVAAAFLALSIAAGIASGSLTPDSNFQQAAQGIAIISFIAAFILGIWGTALLCRKLARTYGENLYLGFVTGILSWIVATFTFGLGLLGGLLVASVVSRKPGWKGFLVGAILGVIFFPLAILALCAFSGGSHF